MLNIRASSILKSPPASTPILNAIKAKRIVTIDADYIDLSNNSTIEKITGFGEGSLNQREFDQGSTLPKPKFKTTDGKYIDFSQSYLGSKAFVSVALNDPIIFAYIIKVDDWEDQSIKPDWLNASTQRLFSSGSNNNQRRYTSLMQSGVVFREGPVQGEHFLIPETPKGWFAQVIYFDGLNSKVVNSRGELTPVSMNSTGIEPASGFLIGSPPATTTGFNGLGVKHFSCYTGTATDQELVALQTELRNMI